MVTGIRSLIHASHRELKHVQVTLCTPGPEVDTPTGKQPGPLVQQVTESGTRQTADKETARLMFESGKASQIPAYVVTITRNLWRKPDNTPIPLAEPYKLKIGGLTYDPVTLPQEHLADLYTVYCVLTRR